MAKSRQPGEAAKAYHEAAKDTRELSKEIADAKAHLKALRDVQAASQAVNRSATPVASNVQQKSTAATVGEWAAIGASVATISKTIYDFASATRSARTAWIALEAVMVGGRIAAMATGWGAVAAAVLTVAYYLGLLGPILEQLTGIIRRMFLPTIIGISIWIGAIRVGVSALLLPFRAVAAAVMLVYDAVMMLVKALTYIPGLLLSLVKAIANAVLAIPRLAYNALMALPRLLKSAFDGVVSVITATTKTAASAIVSTLTTAFRVAINPGRYIVQPISDAMARVAGLFSRGFGVAADMLQRMSERISGIGGDLERLANRIVTPLTDAAREFAGIARGAQDASDATGIGVANLTSLQYAAREAGVSFDQLEASSLAANRAVRGAATDNGLRDAFDQLAVPFEFLRGLDAERRFMAIGNALDQVQDSTRRAALAERIFGDNASAVLDLFGEGKAAIGAARVEAEKLGLAFGGEAAEGGKVLAIAYQSLKDVLQGLTIQLGSAVAPLIAEATRNTVDLLKVVVSWVSRNKELIGTVFKVATAVASVGTVLLAVGGGIGIVANIVGGVATAFASAATAITVVGGALAAILSPIGLVVAGVAALATYFGRAIPFAQIFGQTMAAGRAQWDSYASGVNGAYATIVDALERISAFVGRTMASIRTAIRANDMGAAAQVAITAAQFAFARGMGMIADSVGGTIGGIINSLASGDFGRAADIASASLEIGFTKARSAIETTWYSLVGVFDDVATSLRKTWNDVLEGIRTNTIRLVASISKSLISASVYDPTGVVDRVRKSLRDAQQGLVNLGSQNKDNDLLDAYLSVREFDRQKEAAHKKEMRDREIAHLEEVRNTLTDNAKAEADARLASIREANKVAEENAQKAADVAKKNDDERAKRLGGEAQRDRDKAKADQWGSSFATFSAAEAMAAGQVTRGGRERERSWSAAVTANSVMVNNAFQRPKVQADKPQEQSADALMKSAENSGKSVEHLESIALRLERLEMALRVT